jgi:hypothetical protein
MNRCAVVIGVNKTGDLPVLNAAVSGAEDFAEWATAQGIQVTLLTDKDGAEVNLGNIAKAIRAFVQQRTFEQLIVFFSGHGILRAPDWELWLLSGAPDDPNDAVNVPGSIWLARNAGIPHVVMISDACRSRPNTTRLSQIQGGVIFPNQNPKPPRPVVDVFYAALPGDPALEVPPDQAVQNYRGIFTECLLKGLKGAVSHLAVDMNKNQPGKPRWVVSSWKLKTYLEEQVPEAASEINIKLQQDPDIRVESHLESQPPQFLAEVSAPLIPKRGGDFGIVRGEHGIAPPRKTRTKFKDVVKGYQQKAFDAKPVQPNIQTLAKQSGFVAAMNQLIDTRGRESFETGTGFTLIGSQIEGAIASHSNCDIFEESGAFQIRLHHATYQKPQSLLMQIAGGRGIPLPVLPGFIGTVLVENQQVVSLAYVPARSSDRYALYHSSSAEIEQRRAFLAVATRSGSFRIDTNPQSLDAAYFLRELKGIDPIFGLYAAYAYAQAGNFEGVESVYTFMSYMPEPVLFDVTLLAGKLFNRQNHTLSPFCPMLTQGWALLTPYEKKLPAVVRNASRSLVPGLWTTFEPEAVKKLWKAIEKGDLQ